MAINKLPKEILTISDIEDLESDLSAIDNDITALENSREYENIWHATTLAGLGLDVSLTDNWNRAYAELSANTTLILDNNLKDGRLRKVVIKNTHASDSIAIALPAHYGDVSPAYIVADTIVSVWFEWDSKAANWHIKYTGVDSIYA